MRGGYIFQELDSEKITLEIGKPCVFSNLEIMRHIFSPISHRILVWSLWDKIFKRNLITGLRFKENTIMSEDMLLLWEILKKAKSVSYRPILGYHYMARLNSATHTYRIENYVDYCNVTKILLEDAKLLGDSILITNLSELYISQLVRSIKDCTKSDVENSTEFIISGQKYIRRYWFKAICSKRRSIRGKIGVILFTFPLAFCKSIIRIIS